MTSEFLSPLKHLALAGGLEFSHFISPEIPIRKPEEYLYF